MNKTEKIKRDMMELWKETFHDSNHYIEIVFDNYFTPDNVFTCYDENRLISALLCVPYEFQILADTGEWIFINALYLCGLATRPEYRRQGIMSQLMETAENAARERNYEMTFLIPADRHLREYYRINGYHDASFRKIVKLDPAKTNDQTNLNIYSIHDMRKKRYSDFIIQLADWCVRIEKEERKFPTLIHSRKDMMAIFEENENSLFVTDGTFDLEKPNLAKVMAVALPEYKQDENGKEYVAIVGEYLRSSHCSIDSVDDIFETTTSPDVDSALCDFFAGKIVKRIVPCDCLQIPRRGEEPYAMIKELYCNEKLTENKNKIFKISLMLD